MSRTWYAYTTGDPLLASSYRSLTGKPGCANGFTVCAIYALGGGDFPTSPLSPRIQDYISDGLSNGVPEPQIPIAAKKYVYMKNLA